jgi:hypothetical protein
MINCHKTIDLIEASNSDTDKPAVCYDDESFCAVKLDNSSTICTVPQSAIFKAPEFTNINDVCFFELAEQYGKGQIIFRG